MKLVIRSASQDDAEELSAVYRNAYRVNRKLGFPMTSESVTVAEVSEWIRTDHISVAIRGGDIVGGVRVQLEDSNRAKISRVAVHEAAKGNGIGTRLMLHAEELAKRKGCDVVWLTTPENHPFLPDWYRRLGYEKVGPHPLDLWEYNSIKLEKRLEGTNPRTVTVNSDDENESED